MLVLTIKESGAVWVGDCKIIVYTARDGRCKMAFDAPQDIHIVRDELLQRDRESL
jgi:sRNA-binding carbon storage regulator CsrA